MPDTQPLCGLCFLGLSVWFGLQTLGLLRFSSLGSSCWFGLFWCPTIPTDWFAKLCDWVHVLGQVDVPGNLLNLGFVRKKAV